MDTIIKILSNTLYRNIALSVLYALVFYIVYRIVMHYIKKMHHHDQIKFSLDNRIEQLIVQIVKLTLFIGYVYLVLLQFGLTINALFVNGLFKISLQVILYLVAGIFSLRFGVVLVDRLVMSSFKGGDVKRQMTISKILQSILRYFVWFVVVMGILDAFSVPTTTILTSAGVFGVAIGFGAQDLVKDIIRGFFIIFEGQFQIGDIVEIGGFRGEVVELGLKTTRIKSITGEVKIIANGNIDTIINFSKGNCLSIVDLGIDYGADISDVNNIINEYVKSLKDPRLKSDPIYLGVNELADSAVVLRIVFEAEYIDQFPIRRKILEELKNLMDQNNVSIPFPQMVVHRGE
jgi:small conductance mechanosensitive channel